MDKLHAMRVFVAIADAGSLSGAARALGSSLPAVVRTLAAFEAELGVRLYNRTTRRIALTDEGRRHLERCRDLLAQLAAAEAELRDGAAEPAGSITITAPVLYGQWHVAPAVTRFVQRHPKVSCRVLLHDRVVDLLDESIDLAVRIGELSDSSLVALPLGSVRRIVAASPAFVRAHGVPAHPLDLARFDCLGFIGAAPHWWTFDDAGRTVEVVPRCRLAFNHIGPIVDACVAGLGVGRFVSYQIAAPLADGRLQPLLPGFEPPPRAVSLVYPHARLLPARVRQLIDWLRAELAPAGMTG